MKKFKIKFGSVLILCLLIGFLLFGSKSFANSSENDLGFYEEQVYKAFNDENWQELKRISEIAVKFYTKSMRISPSSAGYQNRGVIFLLNKQYDKAIADFDKALELSPNDKTLLQHKEASIKAKQGVVIIMNGDDNNIQVKSPLYLATEYKQMTEVQKKKYINAVLYSNNNVVPAYYMKIAEEIYPTDKNLAAFLYTAGMFRSTEDVQMCKDQTAQQGTFLFQFIAPETTTYISKMENKERIKLLQDVLDWDEKYPNRPDPKWICYHGIEAFDNDGEVETYSKAKFEKIKKGARKSITKAIKTVK